MSHTKKRERAPNFTVSEKLMLIDFIRPNLDIIENKRTDKLNTENKVSTWNEITNKFNRLSQIVRTTTQLRILYDNLKHDSRKEYAKCHSESDSSYRRSKQLSTVAIKVLQLVSSLNKDSYGTGSPSGYGSPSGPNSVAETENQFEEEITIEDVKPFVSNISVSPRQSLSSDVDSLEPQEPPPPKRRREETPKALHPLYNPLDLCGETIEEKYFQMKKEKHDMEMRLLEQQLRLDEKRGKLLDLEIEMMKNKIKRGGQGQY